MPEATEVELSVALVEGELSLGEILKWRPGATVRFPRRADAPLVLEVGGERLGSGRAVVRDGRLGVVVEELAAARQR